MAAKCIVLLASIALAHGAMVRRDAPTDVWQDLAKHAENFQKTFSEQFANFMKPENTQHFSKAVQDGSESVLQQLTTFANSLNGAISDASGKAKEALEQTKHNVEHAAEELRKAHPDIENSANVLREKLQAAMQTTVQESQKLAKEFATNVDQANEALAPKVKQAYEDFVKHAEEVQKNLHEASTKQ